ncbi:MAG TPA: hypothetical protein VM802_18885, partial [Chitinophaga sp.]|uniref:hypothetical protein n=1 Tax=Chitinophaga sp. TaxID=1869181 RepID=UPI002BE7FC84
QPFSLPDHYFETLEIVTPVEMPTMRVVHRKNRLGWFKWAVAACLIGFVGTTALLFIENDKSNSIDRQLEKVSDQDIVDYLQAHTDTFDNETILAGFNESNAAESLQEHLNELSLPAAEKYLQQPYPENEVVPNQ